VSRRSRGRLEHLAALVPVSVAVADIGAGDLALARLMLARGRAGRVVAVELGAGAYARACARAARDGRIDVRHGDGFAPVAAGEVGAAVVAGLGGAAIARILRRAAAAADPALPPTLVLAPTGRAGMVRAALADLGYRIDREVLVAEGSYLRVLVRAIRTVAAAGADAGPPPRGGELEVGRLVLAECDALRAAYLQERMAVWRRQARSADGVRRTALEALAREVEDRL
jgi:tRNA (adenine22-N1)-methyltransferase